MRRALLILAVLTATLVAIAPPAAACSCDGSSAGSQLQTSEAAFIGTYVERGNSGDVAGDNDGFGDENIGYLFEVEVYLKGDFTSPSLYVSSADNGAACGFETSPGDYVAVFMYGTEDGIPNSGLCSYVDGNAAKASLVSAGIDSDGGPAQFLVSSPNEAVHLWLLDKSGRRVGFAERPENIDDFAQLSNISLCPDSNLLVESWAGDLIVRDLTTLEILPDLSISVPGGFVLGGCFDAEASQLVAIDQNEVVTVVLPEPADEVVLARQFGGEVATGADAVVIFGTTGVTQVNLDGTTEVLYEPTDDPGLSQPNTVEGVSVSPSGDRVAFEVTHYGQDRPQGSTAYIADLTTGELIEAEFDLEGASLRWLTDDRLWFASYNGNHRLLDDSLNEVDNSGDARFDATEWVSPSGAGDVVWYIEKSELTARNLVTGETETIAEVATEPWGSQLIRLADPVEVTAKLPVADGEAPPLGVAPVETEGDQPNSEPIDPDDDSEPAGSEGGDADAEVAAPGDNDESGRNLVPFFIGAAVLALLAVGAGLLIRPRRQSNSPA